MKKNQLNMKFFIGLVLAVCALQVRIKLIEWNLNKKSKSDLSQEEILFQLKIIFLLNSTLALLQFTSTISTQDVDTLR